MNLRDKLKDKRRIVIKIGSSSLTHRETGALNLSKMEILVRELSDIRNMGKEVILVSSGAIAVGSRAARFERRPEKIEEKQACAAIGQARLMMIYQKLFSEYNQVCAQILMTKRTVMDNLSRHNALNTFQELLKLGAIPIVNENDTVSTYEMQFGDNDTLSAIVASLVNADLLILLSDIDGLFTDDPTENPNAQFIDVVEKLDERLLRMGKATSSSGVGSGGMASKLTAADIATNSGIDMVIANGRDFHIIHKILDGRNYGTLFLSQKKDTFYLMDYLEKIMAITQEKIDRINELARLQRAEGLTEAERLEQAALRREYIEAFRMNLKSQLDNIKIRELDGSITDLGEKYGKKAN